MAIHTGLAPQAFQLSAAKGAIKLEKLGMRHSSGKSARKAWAKHFGMPANSTHEQVIERIQEELNVHHS